MPRRASSWIAAAATWLTRRRTGPLATGSHPVPGTTPPSAPPENPPRKVTLRAERTEAGYRHLEAYVDHEGRLHVNGQDLGPGTATVSGDGEYEWFQTIAAADVPRVVALLGGRPGDDVLDILERDFTGPKSYDLEARLRASGIKRNLDTWSG
jgi:hypothetical protein